MTKARNKDLLVGKRLGDYRLSELLATGGMARIYRAEDVNLGRKAAVKVLLQDQPDPDQSLTRRFEREAKAIAALDHENIIPIYQFRQEDGMYFLAMKFIDGHDLSSEISQLHNRKQLMDVPRAMFILGQVAGALDHAHKANVIHRDVKPSNILLTENDKAILTDFGLVLAESVEKTMGTAFGTPRYIAPEQAIASEKAVPQSDIYALAIVAYELLTGQTPFNGETPMEIALAHVSDPPPTPRSINPNVPPAVEAELLRALEKDPTKRHASAAAFVNALKVGYGIPLNAIYTPQPTASSAAAAPATVTEPDAPPRGRARNAPLPKAPAAKAAPEPARVGAASSAAATPKARGRGAKDSAAANSAPQPSSLYGAATGDINQTPAFAPAETANPKAAAAEHTLPPHVRSSVKSKRGGRRSRLPLLLFSTMVLVIVGVIAVGLSGSNGSAQTGDNSGGALSENIDTSANSTSNAQAGNVEVRLVYDEDAIFIINGSSTTLLLDDLRFVRDGRTYAVGTALNIPRRTLPAGMCVRISREGRTAPAAPRSCGSSLHGDIRLPFESLFWFAASGSATFEVQQSSRVLERCAAVLRGSDGECPFLWSAVEANEAGG